MLGQCLMMFVAQCKLLILVIKQAKVTSKKDQQQYWMKRDEPYRFVTTKEFAEAYKSFHVGRKLGENLATPYDKSKSHPVALTHEKYGLNNKELLKACTDRNIAHEKKFLRLFLQIVPSKFLIFHRS